jgi:hypothetical protein
MSTNPLHDPANHSVHGLSFGLGAVLMCNYFDRLKCGIFGPNEVPSCAFTDAVWIEAGYAIDAPEEMPAGGMTSYTTPDDDEAIPEQLLAARGPAA